MLANGITVTSSESQNFSNAMEDMESTSEIKRTINEASSAPISKPITNYRPFEVGADVPKSLYENKEELSNSVVSTATSICTTGKFRQ